MSKPRHLTATVKWAGTPVFRGHALMLDDAKRRGWNGTLVSADRRKGVAERYGKLSQARLYAAWLAWHTRHVLLKPFTRKNPPLPANSPGHSTHELRSDAVAYPAVPAGKPLPWWCLGLDVTEPDLLLRVLQREGYAPFRPYPTGTEAHHLNLRKSPTRNLKKRGLWK